MRIYFSPIVGDIKLEYQFKGDKITCIYTKATYEEIEDTREVTLDENGMEIPLEPIPPKEIKTIETDEFDFTGLPDGKLETQDVITDLPIQPIISAEKIEGVLYVELLNFIKEEDSDFHKFPDWIEVGGENG